MLRKIRPLFVMVQMFICCALFGQSITSSQRNFNMAIGQQSRLFNGPGYDFYPFFSDTSAYFGNLKTFAKGIVNYDGETFRDIPLLYDLHDDLVITLSHDSVSKFSLLSERLSDFYLQNHHFVRIEQDTLSADHPMNAGFYELIYDGKVKILVKHYKRIQEAIDSREYKKFFVPGEDYFLFMDGVYNKVNSEGAFLSLFKSRKKEFQKYLKLKNLKFRKSPELALQALANYYENLAN